MEPWLVVWLVVILLTIVALLAFLAFLVRHAIVLGRTAGRMQDELRPVLDEVAAASARAADEVARLSARPAPGAPREKGRR